MTRLRTGIKGFDALVQGGFPQGFIILVSGTPGTGKTLFGLEYLCNGAKKFRERGMFITLEQKLDEVRTQAKGIGLELGSLERKGALALMHIPVSFGGGFKHHDWVCDKNINSFYKQYQNFKK